MNTNELVARLQAAYPGREVEVVAKSDTAFVDETGMPEQLVGIVHEDFLIIDPYISECGRFPAVPADYGIAESDAREIAAHNGVQREECAPAPPFDPDEPAAPR